MLPVEYVFIILLIIALGALTLYTLLVVSKLEKRDSEYQKAQTKLQEYNDLLITQTKKAIDANKRLQALQLDPDIKECTIEKGADENEQ